MATIGQYLSLITNAVYGEEVRSAIVNAIQQCYTDATDVVKVSETQPTSENTRIWIKPTTDECKVPTWEEFQEVASDTEDLKGALNNDTASVFATEDTSDVVVNHACGWTNGWVNDNTGEVDPTYANIQKRLITPLIDISKYEKLVIKLRSGYSFDYVLYNANGGYILGYKNWITSTDFVINDLGSGAHFIRIMLRNNSERAISPNVDASNIFAYGVKHSQDFDEKIEIMRNLKVFGEHIYSFDDGVYGILDTSNEGKLIYRTNNTRVISEHFHYVPEGRFLHYNIPADYIMKVTYYDVRENGMCFVGDSPLNLSGSGKLQAKGQYFRISVVNTSSTALDTDEIEQIAIKVIREEPEFALLNGSGWFVGQHDTYGVIDTTNPKRIYSDVIDLSTVNCVIHIECATGYQGSLLFYYDDGSTYLGAGNSWYNDGAEVLPRTKKIRMMIRHSDNGNITVNEYGAVHFYIEKTEYQFSTMKWRGKTISIMGDSICTFGGSVDDPSNERWSQAENIYTYPGNRCRYPQTSLGIIDPRQTWWMRLIDTLGMTLMINESWAGSTVSWNGIEEVTDRGANKHMASITRIGHLKSGNNPPDVILVHGGANDIFQQDVPLGTVDYSDPTQIQDYSNLPVSTFADAYRTMLVRMMHQYPKAKIICLLPNQATTFTNETLDEYCEIIKEICDFLCITWVDVRTFGMTLYNKSEFLGDSIHYNLKGAKMYADGLIKKFLYDIPLPEYDAQ